MTTAAQNMHVFLQKSPLCRSHFFEWLKTAISSNACGTSTLKSPLLRAFFTPHVHPRPRKRPPRCTLDCGFKTSESPALRDFVAERCPIRGTSLYLVLKSNGLRHSKNPPVKFGFSLKTVHANIAKKSLPQCCSKPLFIAFSTSRTNAPRLLSRAKVCTHSAFGEGSHTAAHTAKQGPSLPRSQRGLELPVKMLRSPHLQPLIPPRFYIHTFPGSLWTTIISNSSISDHLSSRFSASRTNGPRLLSRAKAGTHSAFGEGSHTAAYTPKQGAFRMGVVSLPSDRSARSRIFPGRVSERRTLPLLGLGRVYFRRTQKAFGTAMRLCASLFRRRRGPTGLRCPVAAVRSA